MRKASLVVNKDYQNNQIFNLSNQDLNRDNCLYPFFLLKNELKKYGYELLTNDLISPATADLVIYNEMPKHFPRSIDKEKSFLMLFETELIRKDNWNLENHNYFKKIFTWNDKFIDGKKYIKFNFPNEIKSTLPGFSGRDGFLTLIAGNKTSSHLLELYSERLKTIRWYERNHPDEFNYYGIGWDYSFDVWWQKIFRKLHLLNLFPKYQSPSFKGRVEQKLSTLRKYKFVICFENAKEIDGYITEKIFDCLFAGSIPIYWGPKNITKYIPSHCFIDRTQFESNEELYLFLKQMSDEKILDYQRNIEKFLKSEDVTQFSNEFFVKNIIKNILNE